MLRRALVVAFAAASGLAMPALVSAQASGTTIDIRVAEPNELQELILTDGSSLVGRVLSADEPVVFELMSGARVEVARAQITRLRIADGVVRDGQMWRRDPSSNRMFFGPTGSTIGQGEGYFAVFELYFPAVGVGITDRFSVAGGTILMSLDDARPFWIIPKLQLVDEPTFDLSVGALAIGVAGSYDFETVGIVFSAATWGDELSSLTVGAGWGWVEDDFANTPAILFGAEGRVSNSVNLMTENYWIPTGNGDSTVILAAGPRFLGERLSADIALAWVPEADFAFFPLVNFVWNW